MLNNNHKSSVCAFAESLVAYLYDEANAAEKTAFEAHLVNCATCSFELKEFGYARTAVHEWRAADFDRLPTPIFEIPARTLQSSPQKSESPAWFDGWRRIFSFKPALALAALAILIALFSVVALVFNFKADKPLAENIKVQESTKTTVSPTVENKIAESKEIVTSDKAKTADVAIKNPPSKVEERKSVTVTPEPLKNPLATTPKLDAVKAIQADVKKNPKPKIAPSTDVPQLTETGDEEDDSIRLADLFDEIGTE